MTSFYINTTEKHYLRNCCIILSHISLCTLSPRNVIGEKARNLPFLMTLAQGFLASSLWYFAVNNSWATVGGWFCLAASLAYSHQMPVWHPPPVVTKMSLGCCQIWGWRVCKHHSALRRTALDEWFSKLQVKTSKSGEVGYILSKKIVWISTYPSPTLSPLLILTWCSHMSYQGWLRSFLQIVII